MGKFIVTKTYIIDTNTNKTQTLSASVKTSITFDSQEYLVTIESSETAHDVIVKLFEVHGLNLDAGEYRLSVRGVRFPIHKQFLELISEPKQLVDLCIVKK